MTREDLPESIRQYYGGHGTEYTPPPRTGRQSVPVLQFLWGRKLDEAAFNFIDSLSPSCVRIVDGEEKTDSRPWRVTIRVNDDGIIHNIDQEATVGLRGGYEHAHDMLCKTGLPPRT